jgi:hypothetical protein
VAATTTRWAHSGGHLPQTERDFGVFATPGGRRPHRTHPWPARFPSHRAVRNDRKGTLMTCHAEPCSGQILAPKGERP